MALIWGKPIQLSNRLRRIKFVCKINEYINVKEALNELCEIVKKHAVKNEKIGLKIMLSTMYPLFIEYRNPENISYDVILNRISGLMQSNENVKIDEIQMEATYFKIDK